MCVNPLSCHQTLCLHKCRQEEWRRLLGASSQLFILRTHNPFILHTGLGCGNQSQLPHSQSYCSPSTGQSVTFVLTQGSLATRLQHAQWIYTYNNPLYKVRPPLGRVAPTRSLDGWPPLLLLLLLYILSSLWIRYEIPHLLLPLKLLLLLSLPGPPCHPAIVIVD